MHINQPAPNFDLYDENGRKYNLDDFRGKKLILYFYPKDDTPGCTVEACSFRDNFSEIKEHGVEIVGIGKGNKNAHKKFKEKYNLPFILLVDENLETSKTYGVVTEKSMFGKSYLGIKRTTFLINEKGFISHIWENVNPSSHIKEIIPYL